MNSLRSSAIAAFVLAAAAGLSAQSNTFPATGSVGIGTTAPAQKLDVRDANGGYIQLNPFDGALELASGNDAYSFIDFRGSSNLGFDYKGRFGFSDNSGFSLMNNGSSELVLNLVSGRTNSGLMLNAGAAGDAGGEFWFVRNGPAAGDLYLGGNATGHIVLRSGGYTNRMVIDPAGNVGIGTNTLDARLALRAENVELTMGRGLGDGSGYARFGFTSDYSQYIASNARWNGSQWQYVNPGGYGGFATRFTNSAGQFRFDLANGGSAPAWRTGLLITNAGDVGIGTQSPSGFGKLAVAGTISTISADSGHVAYLAMDNAGTGTLSSYSGTGAFLRFCTTSPSGVNAEQMRIGASGNVGIGTTNPTNKLEVAGTLRAKEVIVETTGWSDYVFASNYRLAPLSEVEAHIAAKGTLPGIPSAAEVATQGVSVGDMQAKLLAKVEELTLHLIALEKENAALKTRVAALETQ